MGGLGRKGKGSIKNGKCGGGKENTENPGFKYQVAIKGLRES